MKKKLPIFIVILLSIILMLIIIINVSDEKINEIQNETNVIVEQSEIKQPKPVKSASAFFTAQSCADKYLIAASSKKFDEVYKILDQDYIMEKGITQENVIDKIEAIPESTEFRAKIMFFENIDDNNIKYYMTGELVKFSSEDEEVIKEDFKITVILDYENMIFSIIPLENGGF